MKVASLETEGIRKDYPGTVALDGVSVRFEGGAINAIVGKNGAGKSTFVKILAGAVRPTAGVIRINGTPVQLRSPGDALSKGIATVYQELTLVPELTVAENVLLGRLPRRRGLPSLVDWAGSFSLSRSILESLGVSIDVEAPVRTLGVARQQMVEIARAMSYRPSVLMLDEPTSALARHETESLFRVLKALASRGVVILYITHRLQEIREIAHFVTVLRNGAVAGTLTAGDATPDAMARLMFGDVVRSRRPADVVPVAERVLQVRGLFVGERVRDVSFDAYRGEVLGIAGLLGSGRTELLRAIAGAGRADAGDVVVFETPVRRLRTDVMTSLGVVLAPEDRKHEGLVQILSTRQNMALASLGRIARRGLLTRAMERRSIAPHVDALGITIPDVEAPVSTLSGGNQQKVVVGKWMATHPRIVLLDEPTRGIDIQAKQQMYEIIWNMSRRGITTIVVSSELEELLEMCHRILVMRGGSVVAQVAPESTTMEALLAQCLG